MLQNYYKLGVAKKKKNKKEIVSLITKDFINNKTKKRKRISRKNV